jgi:hypothetical protein
MHVGDGDLDQVVRIAQYAAVAAVEKALGKDMATRGGMRTASGTVTSVDRSGSGDCLVIPDGSEIEIGADVVCAQSLAPGDRVFMLMIPPSYAVVVGKPQGEPDYWHVVGDPEQVPYGTGWGPQTGSIYPDDPTAAVNAKLMFRKTGHYVEIRGACQRDSGGGTTIVNLPDGYRPRNNLRVPCFTQATGETTRRTPTTCRFDQTGDLIFSATGMTTTVATPNVDSASGGFLEIDFVYQWT